MYRDYRDQVNFFYIYKRLAHPETNNYLEPATLQERLLHVAEAQRMTGTSIPWLCDSMDDATTKAFGEPYNGEFVLDADGVVVHQRFWSNPITLRGDLEQLVGPVEKPTKVSDLPVRFRPEPRNIASGVVPRIDLPRGLAPVQVRYIAQPKEVLYFKLRAELVARQSASGSSQLYLGFYPDPIHRVHWNNAAGPVEVDIDGERAAGVDSQQLLGPEVEEAADVDPRMFLISVGSTDPAQVLTIRLEAVVCDDAETFCKPITQTYEVQLSRSRNGSTRPDIFLTNLFAKVREFDRNQDQRITADELPEGQVTLYMTHIDYDLDNIIDEQEIQRFMMMYNNGRGIKP